MNYITDKEIDAIQGDMGETHGHPFSVSAR